MTDIALLLRPKPHDLGDFQVRRVLPAVNQRSVGPFVFFDHLGPVNFAPGSGMDVRPHPHIGLATVTYLFEGEILHRDSLGSVQAIASGDVNWMTAGRGIVHSERASPEKRASGFALHGIQTWVALPLEAEETDPAFHHHPSATLPEWREGEVGLKLIAGTFGAHASPVKTFAPIFYLDTVFDSGGTFSFTAEHDERAVYTVTGELLAGGEIVPPGEMAILSPGIEVGLTAGPGGARAMLLGGAALDAPRHIWWNFVSSSRERIEKAKADWRAMAIGTIPGDDAEFIPLPEH